MIDIAYILSKGLGKRILFCFQVLLLTSNYKILSILQWPNPPNVHTELDYQTAPYLSILYKHF